MNKTITNYEPIKSYDPNRHVLREPHYVELTFMQWGYSNTAIIKTGGNCMGFDVLDAVDSAYDALPRLPDGPAYIELTNANGDVLECADDDEREENWLKRMCVSVRFVEPVEEKSNA